jgi:hypothetical protein
MWNGDQGASAGHWPRYGTGTPRRAHHQGTGRAGPRTQHLRPRPPRDPWLTPAILNRRAGIGLRPALVVQQRTWVAQGAAPADRGGSMPERPAPARAREEGHLVLALDVRGLRLPWAKAGPRHWTLAWKRSADPLATSPARNVRKTTKQNPSGRVCTPSRDSLLSTRRALLLLRFAPKCPRLPDRRWQWHPSPPVPRRTATGTVSTSCHYQGNKLIRPARAQ